MKGTLKALHIGRLVITTKAQLENIELSIDPKEIWCLFKRAVKEKKIVFEEKKK